MFRSNDAEELQAADLRLSFVSGGDAGPLQREGCTSTTRARRIRCGIVARDEGGAMADRRAFSPITSANLIKSILRALREAGDPTRGGPFALLRG